MEQMLVMVAMLLSTEVNGKHCWNLDAIANGYMQYRHAEHLREIAPDKVDVFNKEDPPTDWKQVWLMDLPEHRGVILAGYEDMVCSIGNVSQKNYEKVIVDLEGGKT